MKKLFLKSMALSTLLALSLTIAPFSLQSNAAESGHTTEIEQEDKAAAVRMTTFAFEQKRFIDFFPDVNFAKAISAQLGRSHLSNVSTTELANLNGFLMLSNKSISNITGIGYLTGYTYINLNNNQITVIPAEIKKLTNLQTFYLNNNLITAIPAEIGNVTNLLTLDLNYNKLTAIPAQIKTLTKLRFLSLGSNQITAIPSEIGNLTSLKQIHLEDNRIASIPASIKNLVNLSELFLGENKIGSLPPEIGNLSGLTMLSLGYNDLNTLPIEIGKLSNLNALHVEYNHLLTLPAEIKNLSKLTEIYAFNNQMTMIPAEITQLTQLKWLHFGDNRITEVPASLDRLSNLSFLALSNNQITIIPTEISKLSNLKRLHLDGNNITVIPAELGRLSKLMELYLNDNQITVIPHEIGNLTNLMELYLNDNQLTAIPAEIGNLEELYALYLNDNQLTAIPVEIGNLVELCDIALHNNKLTSQVPGFLFTDEFDVFTIHNQNALLSALDIEKGDSVEYNRLLPAFMLQIQGVNGGNLNGQWRITNPDGVESTITSNIQNAMSSYIFNQAGNYQVDYFSASHLESMPENLFVGVLNYTTTVRVEDTAVQMFDVTYQLNGGTLVSGALLEEVILNGNPANVPKVSHTKFKFIGWMDKHGNIVDPTTVTITENTTFIAQFKAVEYVTVRFNPGTGFITGGERNQSVEKGEKPTSVPTVTNPFGNFIGWKDKDGNIVDPTAIAVFSNTTYTAVYDTIEQ